MTAPAVTYRSDDGGRWGSGKGSNLTAAEVDINFWNVVQAIADLVASAPQPDDISSITQSGTNLIIHLTSGTTFTIAVPVVQFRWRGDWAPTTSYLTLDAFKVDGVGVFSVNENHTSAGSFDPAAVDGSSNPLYFQMFGVSSITNLEQLLDVSVVSPGDGQVLSWNDADGLWEAVWPGMVRTVSKTADYTVSAAADNGLHFNNHGASATVNLSLPAAAVGLAYGLLVDAAHQIGFTANGTDKIAIGATNSAAGGTVTSSTPFSFLKIECHVAGQWVASSQIGSWTVT